MQGETKKRTKLNDRFFWFVINLFMQIPSSRDKILYSAIKSNVKNKQFLKFVKVFNIL